MVDPLVFGVSPVLAASVDRVDAAARGDGPDIAVDMPGADHVEAGADDPGPVEKEGKAVDFAFEDWVGAGNNAFAAEDAPKLN
mmetsp:Transcript_16616/g.34076  ORF Transcript_16616/g.34076 Transcript_16616/m.34076 type:complete len:83 (+) Transcript_16616:1842-2090(+)